MAENHQEKSIHEALGLSNAWKKENAALIEDELQNHETISESIMESMHRIKTEEFGEGEYTMSEYEKKLYYAGFTMAQEIMSRKMEHAKVALIGKAVLGAALHGLFGEGDKDDEKKKKDE